MTTKPKPLGYPAHTGYTGYFVFELRYENGTVVREAFTTAVERNLDMGYAIVAAPDFMSLHSGLIYCKDGVNPNEEHRTWQWAMSTYVKGGG